MLGLSWPIFGPDQEFWPLLKNMQKHRILEQKCPSPKLKLISYNDNAIANGSRRHTINASAPSVRADFSPMGFVVQSSRINIQCRHQRKTWRRRSTQVSGCFWFLGAFRILRKQWGPWTSTWTPPAMNSKWRGVDIQPLDSLMGWWVDVLGILSYVLYVLCVLLAFCKELGIVTLFNWNYINETFYFWEVLASTMMRCWKGLHQGGWHSDLLRWEQGLVWALLWWRLCSA